MLTNNIIPRRIIRMKDIEKMKVAEHNDLITSVAKMDKIPLKMFELAVSCIDTKDPPENNTVFISKSALFEFFDVNDSNRYARFKKYVTRLHAQSVFEVREKIGDKEKYDFKVISPIESTDWNNYDDVVAVKFTESIMPYLLEFSKGQFTQYMIMDIKELSKKHSIVLYKWLIMNFNQYNNYKYATNRTRQQKYELKNPTISVSELRRITNTKKDYSRFTDFEKWVIKNAVDEINEHTHLNIKYQKIKKGRNITDIQFFISEKARKIARPLDSEYLDERPSKEERERQLVEMWSKSVEHKYTKILSSGKYKILSTADVINKDKMVSLMEYVYPLMDELESLDKKGINRVVKRILNYVHDVDDNKLVNYLRESFLNEVNKVKFDRKMNEIEG